MFSLYLAMMVVGMGQTVVFAILPMLGRELHLDLLVFNVPFSDIVIAPRELAITSLSALPRLFFLLQHPSGAALVTAWDENHSLFWGCLAMSSVRWRLMVWLI